MQLAASCRGRQTVSLGRISQAKIMLWSSWARLWQCATHGPVKVRNPAGDHDLLTRVERDDVLLARVVGVPATTACSSTSREPARTSKPGRAADTALGRRIPNRCSCVTSGTSARCGRSSPRRGIEPVPPATAYWAEHGVTFEDPDGFRGVLVRALAGVAAVR